MLNGSLAQGLKEKLFRVFVILILGYVAASAFAPMLNQVDLGWQVAQGRWIVHHFAPYSRDAFNYPTLDRPIVNEYPLFEVILYAATCFGWWGPCLLTALVYAGLVTIFLQARRSFQASSAGLAVALGLMLLLFQIAFPLRPHVATYLGVAVLGVFLLRHREAQSWTVFWPMALLQIAWTNCHSGFVIGPAMTALFGLEICARRWLRERRLPLHTMGTWLGATAFILLACLVNPYGWQRFYPPLLQDRLESIRAYVGEMEPLRGGMATIYSGLILIAALTVLLVALRRGGGNSFAFLLLAGGFCYQAHDVQKAWPLVGLFLPLLVLSSAVFGTAPRRELVISWAGVLALFAVGALTAMAFIARFDPAFDSSLSRQWNEYDHGRTEMPIDATDWLRAHGISGRLFHRCEDGGWLQMNGYDHGDTFADTGFGKYDEAFIHEVGLVNERPAMLPVFLTAYRPAFVVCNNFAFQWPYYLQQAGWHPVFYSPNSSVWQAADAGPALPVLTDAQIESAFDDDLSSHGIPADVRLFGRNIIALNSLGLEDFAYAKLAGLPPELHHAAWYWEAARIMCFSDPPMSQSHRDAFESEAHALGDEPTTADFRAHCRDAAGDTAGALRILQAMPPTDLTDSPATLLLKIELAQDNPNALALARHLDLFDLRNGKHWQYLAQAEARANDFPAASEAWRKAVFYYPDDADLVNAARDFALVQRDADLQHAIDSRIEIHDANQP